MTLRVIDILNRAYQMIQIKSKIVSSVFVKRHTPSKAFGYQFFIEITRTSDFKRVMRELKSQNHFCFDLDGSRHFPAPHLSLSIGHL